MDSKRGGRKGGLRTAIANAHRRRDYRRRNELCSKYDDLFLARWKEKYRT